MEYGQNTPFHSLSVVQGFPESANAPQAITYSNINKVKSITQGDKQHQITYGVNQQRIKGTFKTGSTTTLTKYYLGNYEEEVVSGKTRKLHYIYGGNGLAAIMEYKNGQENLFYTFTDYQGNLLAVTNTAGTERYAYDPWGARRNPDNWTQPDTRTSLKFSRGYTLHEHLDDFGLINMNGRVYDPLMAQFFSPDPHIQSPENWYNYNRYAYCYNNPLIYTDPSGEFIFPIAFAIWMNVTVQGMSGNVNSAGDFFKAIGVGAVSGLAGFGAGQLVAGAVGTIGFAGGAMTGAAGGFAGGFVGGAGNAWAGGASFGQGLGQGLIGGGFGAVTGGLIGGISGGITATKHGGDFWSGEGAIFESSAAAGLTPENVKVGEGMEYTTKYANGVADDTYGKLSYVERIATNEVPVGDGYTLNNGCIINKDGGMANGLTRYLGKSNSEVYLGKSAFTSVNQLNLTIGHEYIHATQNYMAFKKGIKNVNATYRGYPMAEIAAHNWESTMGVSNGFGAWTGKLGAWSWSRQPYYNWLLNANF